MKIDLSDFGKHAPPRSNGELVFDAPWQGRAFGTAAALVDAGHFSWPVFQAALIDEVDADQDGDYWTAWLRATTSLVHDLGLLDKPQLSERRLELAHQSPDDH